MTDVRTTNQAKGEPESVTHQVLETATGLAQDLAPVKRICAHLNAFHASVSEPGRCIEANHYCSHVNEEIRQCILYDSDHANARLIGIEYMISERLFDTLSIAERSLWHSHIYEVKSGMLIMPKPPLVPEAAWELAENKEMEAVVKLYGKVYHLWQTDLGHELPLGPPLLMTSFTEDAQIPEFRKIVGERDERFGSDWKRKKEVREYIEEPTILPGADSVWKNKK